MVAESVWPWQATQPVLLRVGLVLRLAQPELVPGCLACCRQQQRAQQRASGAHDQNQPRSCECLRTWKRTFVNTENKIRFVEISRKPWNGTSALTPPVITMFSESGGR